MEIKSDTAQKGAKAVSKEERRSKANQRAVAGKLPALLENAWQPVPVENLMRITDEELHQQLLNADLGKLIAASEQPISTLMARAVKSKTTTQEGLVICLVANRAIRALEYLAAQGNFALAKELYRTVRLAVANLNERALNKPGLFKSTASNHIDWPVLYSPHGFFATDSNALQENLGIGDGFHLAVFGKWKDRTRGLDLTLPQNYLALRVIELLLWTRSKPQPAATIKQPGFSWIKKARKLRPLTEKTADKWAKVGWEVVLDVYNGKPEEDAFLAAIGAAMDFADRTPAKIHGRIKEQFGKAVEKFSKSPPSTN